MNVTPDLIKKENIKVYSSIGKNYDLLHPEVWNWREQMRCWKLLKKTLHNVSNQKNPLILDVGAGTGNLTLKYLSRGCKVISVDISHEMLSVLKKKLSFKQRKNSLIICADIESIIERIPMVDGICFYAVLHHLYDYINLVRLCIPKIKKGGFFFSMHDPLIQKPKSKSIYAAHRIIRVLDENLYHFKIRLHGFNSNNLPDEDGAEYHQDGMMEHLDLRSILESSGLYIEHFENYVSRRYGFFSWLAKDVFGAENCFAYVARKS